MGLELGKMMRIKPGSSTRAISPVQKALPIFKKMVYTGRHDAFQERAA